MALPPWIILHSPVVDCAALEPFVEQCLKDGVHLIAIWGEGAEALEKDVDWLVIGDGADESRYITTSSHPGESLEEVLEFASAFAFSRASAMGGMRTGASTDRKRVFAVSGIG